MHPNKKKPKESLEPYLQVRAKCDRTQQLQQQVEIWQELPEAMS